MFFPKTFHLILVLKSDNVFKNFPMMRFGDKNLKYKMLINIPLRYFPIHRINKYLMNFVKNNLKMLSNFIFIL